MTCTDVVKGVAGRGRSPVARALQDRGWFFADGDVHYSADEITGLVVAHLNAPTTNNPTEVLL